MHVKADMPKCRVQVKQSEHLSPGGVSPENHRLLSLPRSNSTTVCKRTTAETSQPVQRPGAYSGDSLWESYNAQQN